MLARTLFIALLLAAPAAMAVDRTKSPPDAEVYFIAPADGAKVKAPFAVKFGLKGMGVAPAGTAMANTGHHHLIVDAKPPPLNEPIPNDQTYRHFGMGQTETMVTLPRGRHTLQLLLADQNHIPHDPPVLSKQITIIVE